jgi:hypothetical protein
MTDKLQAGIQEYQQPKPEGDPDLVNLVRAKLIEAGLLHAVQNNFDTNRFIIEANGKNSSAQRFLLNRFWNMQLMYSSKPSTEERYCLIPNGTVQDWLRLFEQKVLPFIIENGLPVKI